MRYYNGKTVVITGAAGGMGCAFSRRFAAAGARLALLDIDAGRLTALEEGLRKSGIETVAVRCDITDYTQCEAALAKAKAAFGSIDVLIANAGITHRSAFACTEMAVYHRVMEVNFFGAVYCARAALPALSESKGQIIVISSIAGLAPLLGRTGYAASKHALHGFFDSLRAELAAQGIAITIVCPGFTATGISQAALDADGSLTRHPQSTFGPIATPEQVANAIFRAASRERRLVVLSAVGKLTYWLTRWAPGLYEKLMARALRRELQR